MDKDSLELEALWLQLHSRLRAFIRSRVADDDLSDDILQDVFIRIHANLDRLRDKDRLESWVYQIARHAIIDHYRSRRELLELTENTVLVEEPLEEDAAATLAPSLKEYVEALPEPYRQALVLTEYHGFSQKELAINLGISFSGAKSRVQRARQKVKDMLLACCHIELDRRGTVIDYYEHCCCCGGS